MPDCAKPLLSIITVVLNRVGSIDAAIDSVRAIQDPRVEFVVVDGGSTDGTLERIQAAEDVVQKWSSGKDAGIYAAMNKGLSMAAGEYVSILGSDDCYIPTAVSGVLKVLCEQRIDVLCAPIEKQGSHGVRIFVPKPKRLVLGMTVPHPGVFARRDSSAQIGYDETLQIAADYKHLLQLRQMGLAFHVTGAPVLRMSEGGISNTQLDLAREEVRLVQRQLLSSPVLTFSRIANTIYSLRPRNRNVAPRSEN
jgi:glycosyltransferase involved in cell wall biosynthesis